MEDTELHELKKRWKNLYQYINIIDKIPGTENYDSGHNKKQDKDNWLRE